MGDPAANFDAPASILFRWLKRSARSPRHHKRYLKIPSASEAKFRIIRWPKAGRQAGVTLSRGNAWCLPARRASSGRFRADTRLPANTTCPASQC